LPKIDDKYGARLRNLYNGLFSLNLLTFCSLSIDLWIAENAQAGTHDNRFVIKTALVSVIERPAVARSIAKPKPQAE
jgi:hypothetical protein